MKNEALKDTASCLILSYSYVTPNNQSKVDLFLRCCVAL